MIFGWFRRRTALSRHESDRLHAFAAMTLNDVRRRAEEFEGAESHYHEWMLTRRERRKHAPDPDEQQGFAPEVAYGHPSKRWRALERELRQRGAWEVGDLSATEQLHWARKLNALTESLSRPHHRRIGPDQPAVRVTELDE